MINRFITVCSNTISYIAVIAVVIAIADGFGWRLQVPEDNTPITTIGGFPIT